MAGDVQMIKRLPALFLLAAGVCLFAQATFDELYRPQYHFSPRINWTNDPCGLVYAFGHYHLFFQHNPFANVWGHMSWGHAASLDLVHWNQLPVAIRDDAKAAIFTGSSVFDRNNTSGLCASREHGCIVSIYTGYTPKSAAGREKQTQNLAVSQDGLTWTKYASNPVLDLGRADTRDPKVFWYEPGKKWVMVIVQADDKKVRLFTSQDLKHWQPLSEFGPQGATGGVWECPDLYTLPIENQPGKMRWILKIGINPGHIAGGSGEQYFIGQFDGKTFTPDEPNGKIRWFDYGRDCYCALTFNNQPDPLHPRVIGWMNNWQYAADVPTSPWRGQMTLPRDIALAEVNGSLQLLQRPIADLHSLRLQEFEYTGTAAAELNEKLSHWPHRSETYELEATIDAGSAPRVEWKLRSDGADATIVGFDRAARQLYVDRSQSGVVNFSGKFPSRTVAPLDLPAGTPLALHIFVDRSSVEVFAQNGAIAMTNLIYPKPGSDGLSLEIAGGSTAQLHVKLWALASIWKNPAVYGK
jgi:fructan beta-fructosidase